MGSHAAYKALLIQSDSAYSRLLETSLNSVNGDTFKISAKAAFADALATLTSEKYDLILVDLDLLGPGGLDAVSLLRTICPRTPVVILTGKNDEQAALECLRRGAQDFISKESMAKNPQDVLWRMKFAEIRQECNYNLSSSETIDLLERELSSMAAL